MTNVHNPDTFIVVCAILVGIAIVSGAIISAIFIRYKERMAGLETARILATKDENWVRSFNLATKTRQETNGHLDVRSGLVLIAVGLGAYLFFDLIANRSIAIIAGIPVLVGAAVLLYGIMAICLRSFLPASPSSSTEIGTTDITK